MIIIYTLAAKRPDSSTKLSECSSKTVQHYTTQKNLKYININWPKITTALVKHKLSSA